VVAAVAVAAAGMSDADAAVDAVRLIKAVVIMLFTNTGKNVNVVGHPSNSWVLGFKLILASKQDNTTFGFCLLTCPLFPRVNPQ